MATKQKNKAEAAKVEAAPVGRPPLFTDPDVMQEGIESYFIKCDDEDDKRPYTMAGLVYHLGFADRQALSEYEKKGEFSLTIKTARTRIEVQRSENLVMGNGSAAGMIFDLKNNFGWKDRTEHEITGPDGGPVKTEYTEMRDRFGGGED